MIAHIQPLRLLGGVPETTNVRSKGNQPSGEKSRFRFVLVEGEVAPGELQMFAQTLAAAIRQPPQTSQVPSNGAITAPPKPQAEQPDLFNDIEPEIEAEPEGESPLPPKPQNGSKKKLRTPQLVSGLEFKSGEKSLEDYIREIDPKEHSKRYLGSPTGSASTGTWPRSAGTTSTLATGRSA